MSTSANTEARLAAPFRPISLHALNAKAAMLERLDNKYIVSAAALEQALPELARHFDMLEIDGRRAFTYQTHYFDDNERRSYFDHHQGRRQRIKVRVRRYVDAGLCFVEVKLKDKRGVTVKKRLPYELDKCSMLDERAVAHVEHAYRELYGRAFGQALAPVLEMSYRRLTLVARSGGERMTIDSGIRFGADDNACAIADGVFIVETKSARGNGIADKVLRGLHQHPTSGCSKYCVGMSLTGAVGKRNKFLPALRRLGAAPIVWEAV